jgi:integrase
MSTKAKNGSGSLERRGANWWVMVSLPRQPGEKLHRKRIPIADSEKMTEAQARKAGAKLAADIRSGRIVFDAAPRRGALPSPAAIMTVSQLGEAWTSGSMFERYGSVNRLRTKATADIDAWILKAHAYEIKTRGPSGPVFGDLSVSSVTSDDVAAVMAAHPKDLSARTVTVTYQCLRRLFDLAIFPCKLRKEGDSPVLRYFRPERDPDKLFCFLYPSEALALLLGTNERGAVAIPLGRRILYALATYTGQRKGSLFALGWKHVDFDHETLASFKTKTGRAQYFMADPGLMAILKAWQAHKGKPGDDEPIVTDQDVAYERKRLATALRDDLKAVGVTRSILFEDEASNVEPLRFHDLRATFCTWARRAGKSDAWISERTGHDIEANMIARYDRGAQTLEGLDYVPFPDISHAVPELAEIVDRLHTRLHKTGQNGSGGRGDDEGETVIIPAALKQSGREDLTGPRKKRGVSRTIFRKLGECSGPVYHGVTRRNGG